MQISLAPFAALLASASAFQIPPRWVPAAVSFPQSAAEVDRGWDTFGSAALRTFEILTGDDWHWQMYSARRATGGMGVLYFVAWIVIGNLILLNLFVAVMTESFEKEYLFNRALQDQETSVLRGVAAFAWCVL